MAPSVGDEAAKAEGAAYTPRGSVSGGTRPRALSVNTIKPSLSTNLAARSKPTNLLDNFAAVLVLALIHAGLLEALQRLGEGFDVAMAAMANELMGELMDLADKLLPRDLCLALHRLPRLVSSACDFRPGANARRPFSRAPDS